MKAFVVDASVAVKWVVPEPFTPEAVRLLRGADAIRAPAHWLAEAANTLWAKFAVRADLSRDEFLTRVAELRQMPVRTTDLSHLLDSAAAIAADLHVTVYDALYLALSATLDMPFVTADRKLVAKARGSQHETRTRWLGEFATPI